MNDDDAFDAMFKQKIDSIINNSNITKQTREDKVVEDLLSKVRDKSPVLPVKKP